MADDRKMFYVRADRGTPGMGIATSIQVIIPEGLDFFQARDYVLGRVTRELNSYFVDECVRGVGIPHPQDAR